MKTDEIACTEYSSLRDEILARIVVRDQMINYAATLFAAVVGLAAHVGRETNPKWTAPILLIYPIVSLVFAHGWATHDMRIGELGTYIRLRTGKRKTPTERLGDWERFLRRRRNKDTGRMAWLRRDQSIFACGAFCGTSMIAMMLAYFMQPSTHIWVLRILMTVDCVVLFLTGLLCWKRKNPRIGGDTSSPV